MNTGRIIKLFLFVFLATSSDFPFTATIFSKTDAMLATSSEISSLPGNDKFLTCSPTAIALEELTGILIKIIKKVRR